MRDPYPIRMSEEREGTSGTAVRQADAGATVLQFPTGRLPMADPSEAGFTALFQRKYDALRRYAFAELRDLDAAEDLVQGVFVGVWSRYFRDGAPPPEPEWEPLLYKGVQLRLLNYRRDRYRLADKLGTILSLWGDRARRWMAPTDEFEAEELTRVLDRAINKMSPKSREIFLLARDADLSYQEIADLTGMTTGAVGSLLHRAQGVLKEQVRKSGFAGTASRQLRGSRRGALDEGKGGDR